VINFFKFAFTHVLTF